MTDEIKKRHGKTKEELAKIGAKTRFKAGKAQAEIARLGAEASNAVQRERKTMRQILDILLEKQIKNSKGVDITTKEGILTAQVAKALCGDLQSAQFIRDTIGEKPTDKQEVTGALGIKKIFISEEDKKAVEEHIADVVGESR